MPAADTFRRRLRIVFEDRLSAGQLGVIAGGLARRNHEEYIRQKLVSPSFKRYVDGKLGPSEEEIKITKIKPGVIRYVGADIVEAVTFCLAYCREISPVLTGQFKAAWIVVVDGAPWRGPLSDITSDKVWIVNFAPFARRLEQSSGKQSPRYKITALAAQETARRFPGVQTRRIFLDIPPGATNGSWPAPYHRKTPPRSAVLYPAVQIGLK